MNSKYSFEKYVYPSRWMSYWYQIKEVLSLKPGKVLEVGVGNKTVTNYFRSQGIDVVTVDIDEKLKPDIVGNVLSMPLKDNSFDVVLCAQVLEHLPFKDFQKALGEIKRVSKRYCVLSLPHWGWMFYLGAKLPFLKRRHIFFKVSGILKNQKNGEHFWEIGRRRYPLKKIRKIISDTGFKTIKDYITSESPYHHFFILKK